MNTPKDYEQAVAFFPRKENINGNELINLLQHPNLQLVDVRNDAELPKINYAKKRQIPMESLEVGLQQIDASLPTVFICHAGVRSEFALHIATEYYGFKHAFHLKGGLIANEEVLTFLQKIV